MSAQGQRVLNKLANKEFVSDPEFDSLLNSGHRASSDVHWTSIEVCRMIIRTLNLGPQDHVLDVGSGVGKLSICLATYANCYVTGIEQREHLVKISKNLKKVLKLSNVEFLAGDALEISWEPYNVIYLFNPFQEHLPDPGTPKLDEKVEFDEDQYRENVKCTQMRLAELEVGTRVVTYYGFGGHLPEGYERIKSRVYQSGTVSFYEKRS